MRTDVCDEMLGSLGFQNLQATEKSEGFRANGKRQGSYNTILARLFLYVFFRYVIVNTFAKIID